MNRREALIKSINLVAFMQYGGILEAVLGNNKDSSLNKKEKAKHSKECGAKL